MTAYAELQVTSNFSFLRGGSHPEELVLRAAELGLAALALTDRNTLAGVVRAHVAARELGLRFVVGARLDLEAAPAGKHAKVLSWSKACRTGAEDAAETWIDAGEAAASPARSVLVFPTDRAAYGRLSELISRGQRRTEKGRCRLWLDDLLAHAEGQIVVALPPAELDDDFPRFLDILHHELSGSVYLAAQYLYRGDDAGQIATLAALAARCRTPLVATGDVLYHVPERRPLQDVLTCIREHCTIDQAGFRLEANAERHLKPPAEMARLFREHPEALARTLEIVNACRFSLDELRYEYPIDPVPAGRTVQQHLEELTWQGAAERYPDGVPDKVRRLLEHEFQLIGQLGYAPYFLTVHDIVRFARQRGILCQGRGSAANSAVCYCLGITAVDPERFDLLFERFVSAERNEPPDIDVDFEHERREEVIQYIYRKYGREHAGIAATVIHYRARSAIREVGKALGLSEDAVGALASGIWGWSEGGLDARLARERGLDPDAPRLRLALRLARELTGFPRHLSQHVGGFVLTRSRLDQVVPVVNAAMAERTMVEWDKDDLDALGTLKIDVLALGMLTCIRKAFELLARHYGRKLDLASVPPEDPAVYEMLGRADSLGVFQVESRAQMTMLPRLRPRCFYDLVIEVAIVRPGPIQGDMVHPYLRRRNGEEAVDYPSEALRGVLEKTLGVPLFQEQAMQIAIVGAGFTASESDQLRRAMATFKRVGTIHKFRDKFIEGMAKNGYPRDFAERCFKQIEGFGTYGFPESHAASFALLVYVSSWLKCHYPEVFACALLNSQPMGFYAPAQIVRDARDHGVTVLPVDVNRSDWDCTLEVAAPPAAGSEVAAPTPGTGTFPAAGSWTEAAASRGVTTPVAAPGGAGTFPTAGSWAEAAASRGVTTPVAAAPGGAGTFPTAGSWTEAAASRGVTTPVAAAPGGAGMFPTAGSWAEAAASRSVTTPMAAAPTSSPEGTAASVSPTLPDRPIASRPGPPAASADGFVSPGALRNAPVNLSLTSRPAISPGPMVHATVGIPASPTSPGHGFPRSHGPAEESISDQSVKIRLTSRPPDTTRASVRDGPGEVHDHRFEDGPESPRHGRHAPARARENAGPESPRHALRLGFRQIKGLAEEEIARLVARRGRGYADLAELRRRAGLGTATLDRLARADAFASLALDRRGALWRAIGLDRTGEEPDPPPLFAWARDQAPPPTGAAGRAIRAETTVALPGMRLGEEVLEDYANLRLTLRAHPLALLRGFLPRGVVKAECLAKIEDGRRVAVAGLVLVRQRPGTASGVIFITLEDETGIANLVVWPGMFERFRRVVLGAQLMVVHGRLQKEGLVIHVVAEHMADRSDLLRRLGEVAAPFESPLARADRLKPGGGVRRRRAAQADDPPFEAPLAHADHARNSGPPDPRDPGARRREQALREDLRARAKPLEAPVARADELKRPGRDLRDLPQLKGFRSRDFH